MLILYIALYLTIGRILLTPMLGYIPKEHRAAMRLISVIIWPVIALVVLYVEVWRIAIKLLFWFTNLEVFDKIDKEFWK